MVSAAIRTFFSSAEFAVVGASSNPAKFGHKLFLWYKAHDLPVTPVNPTATTIETPSLGPDSASSPAVASVSDLPSPKTTSLSIVTPPRATLGVLREAEAAGIPAVWMQPGSFDREVLEYAKEGGRFRAVVAGEDGESYGEEGWCVLVDGEDGLKAAGKL